MRGINDDGETLDAARYLELPRVVVTTDPSVLGIRLSEEDRKAIEKEKQRDGIIDVPYEDVTDGEAGKNG